MAWNKGVLVTEIVAFARLDALLDVRTDQVVRSACLEAHLNRRLV